MPLRDQIFTFKEIPSLLRTNRQLLLEMSKHEITDRYAGQVFGALWAIGHPIVLIGIYVFIFAVVFKLRIGGTRELPLDYATYLLSGLIPWMAFQDSMNKGVNAILHNTNLVKQIVFPIEILPIKVVSAAVVTQVVATVILILYVLAKHGSLPWTYVLLPVLIALQIVAMAGLNFILAAAGAYFRDLKDIVQILSFAGMYIMPIFYLPQWVPSIFKPVLYLNPFSYLTWCYQDACYFGRIEHPWAWVIFPLLSIGTFQMGFTLFRKAKILFGNVL